MEETEAGLKQLISLIESAVESAHFQYDVDESGTVSFVCDPTQLVSVEGITSEQNNEDLGAGSILSNNEEEAEATKKDEKDETNAIVLAPDKEAERGLGAKPEVKVEIRDDLSGEETSSALIQQISRINSPVNYYLQTPNGEFIQVLDSLEEASEESSAGAVQSLEGIAPSENLMGNSGVSTNEDMQIFVVADGNGGEMFLINTPEGQIANDENSTNVPPGLLKTSITESDIQSEIIKNDADIAPLTSDDVNTEGPLFTIALVDDDKVVNKVPGSPSKKQDHPVMSEFCKKESEHSDGQPRHETQFKLMSPAKLNPSVQDAGSLEGLSKTLEEGSIVNTTRGKMIAYNLSSLMKDDISGKHTSLHELASSFGSWVKVLKPIKKEEEPASPTVANKKFAVYSCEECETVLHSERSFMLHRRRFHEEWQEECFICGKKFLNFSYVRSHIKVAHLGEKFFECRQCSFRCSLLKEFFKHCRTHRNSHKCSSCGKKYASPKVLQDHIPNCKGKVDIDFDLGVNDSSDDKQKMKIVEDIDMKNVSYQEDPVDPSSGKRKWVKQRQDLEYKVESKHYNQQIKKMALEQPKQTRTRSRGRTHRCYLCFKLFSNQADLDAHKEVYHHAKSSQPVRVKTDDSLGRDEEDALDFAKPNNVQSLDCDEEVQIKSEPSDVAEKIENVTLVLDEFMNLSQVIEPLCIACRSYTKTDYSQSSKLFQTIARCDQLQALKRFQSYFPHTINLESFMGHWVLCKKCSLLIDKIAEMEEKLNAMKKDWLSRFQSDNMSKLENVALKSEEVNSSTLSSSKVSEGNFDIEKLMKEKFEIFEVVQPPKRKRCHKNLESEKLAPVLLSDDEQEQFSSIDLSKTDGRSEEEISSVINDEGIIEGNVNTLFTAASVKKEIVIEETSDKSSDVKAVCVKSEPLSQDVEPLVLSSQNSSLTDGERCSSKDGNEGDLLLSVSKAKEDSTCDKELPHFKFMSGVDSAASQKKPEGSFVKTLKGEEIASHESADLSKQISSEVSDGESSALEFSKLQESDDLVHENQDTPMEDEGNQEQSVENQAVASGDTTSAGARKQVAEQSDASLKGKKRAKIREKRNMMCSFEENNAPGKQWVCNSCSKGFSTERGACDHYAASHGGKSYSCEDCNVSYVRKRDLIGHCNKVHLKTKPYKCKSCDASFSAHGELYRHMYRVHGTQKKEESLFTCHMCYSSFSQKRYRDAHLELCQMKDSEEAPYTCHICDKSFKLQKYIHQHMKTSHSDKNDVFYCEICDKVLKDKRNLILHMKSHSGESKTTCKICNKQFKRKSYLWAHMKVHTDERPYGCNYCPKGFKQYSTWKNHERRHTGEKPYKCSKCTACFATRTSVTKHLQYAHYNIRDFGCDLCKKFFITKTKLLEHFKTHTGEKPFSCEVCGRAFSRKTNLRSHMYIHSSTKKFKCEICGEGFMRRMAIENHIQERHSELDMFLDSDSSSRGKGSTLTTPFISVNGAEDLNDAMGTYIIVCHNDEDLETEGPLSANVTVFSEDLENSQEDSTGETLKLPTVSDDIDSSQSSTLLSEAVIKPKHPAAKIEVLPTISSEDATSIPMHVQNQIAYL